MVTLIRFGKKRRLVLMFEWLTLWPTWADLPVNSQRRDMAYLWAIMRSRQRRGAGKILARLERGPIMTWVGDVKFGTGASGRAPGLDARSLTPHRASSTRAETSVF